MTEQDTLTEYDTTSKQDPVTRDQHGDTGPDLADVVEQTVQTDEAPQTPVAKTFADFGVSEPIVAALSEVGITNPFPIQSLTLPVALAGHDIIGQAKTGTGKTLGFGIPLLQAVTGPGEE